MRSDPNAACVARLAFISLLALGSASCGRLLGEKAPDASEIVGLSTQEVGCLSGASTRLASYFKGELKDDEQVGALWRCASRSLELFAQKTQGHDQGVYRAEELKRFLEKYFLNGSRIPDEVFVQVMEFKRGLFGGKSQSLTGAEIERVRDLLELIRLHAIALRPYQPLELEAHSRLSEAQLDDLRQKLKAAANGIGELLARNAASYPMENALELFEQLRGYLDLRGLDPILNFARPRLEAVMAFKAVLTGTDPQVIFPSDWLKLFSSGAEAFVLGIEHRQLALQEPTWLAGTGLRRIRSWLNGLALFLEQVVRRHPGGVLRFEKMEALIDSFAVSELPIQIGLRSWENAKPALRHVIQRMLGGSSAEARRAPGLTLDAVRSLRLAFATWARGQEQVERIVNSADPKAYLESMRGTLGRLLRETPALLGEEAGNEVAIPAPAGARKTLHHLSMLNLLYGVVRQGVMGYSHDPLRPIERGFQLEELRELYEDFRQIGIELRIFDPDGEKVPEKRFFESNLLTFAADGDGYADVVEMTQELLLLLSGKALADRIHAFSAQSRAGVSCLFGDLDPYGYPWLDARCFRERLFNTTAFGLFFERFPRFRDFYSEILAKPRTPITDLPGSAARELTEGEQRRLRFHQAFEEATRERGFSDEHPVGSEDIQAMVMLVHYMEVIFARFDRDGSGTLDPQETLLAVPVLASKLREATCFRSEPELRDALAFMLGSGLVQPQGVRQKIKAGWWWYVRRPLAHFRGRPAPDFQADRDRVTGLFAAFARPPSAADKQCQNADEPESRDSSLSDR